MPDPVTDPIDSRFFCSMIRPAFSVTLGLNVQWLRCPPRRGASAMSSFAVAWSGRWSTASRANTCARVGESQVLRRAELLLPRCTFGLKVTPSVISCSSIFARRTFSRSGLVAAV